MRAPPGRLVLLGARIAHSRSPRFQNAALRAAGIPLTYEVMDVAPDHLDEALHLLATQRAAGNVTMPHKEHVAARCTRLTPLARRAGAVNTFWFEGEELIGDNTDVPGIDFTARALLREALSRARVALVGAGGAASALLTAAERWGAARVRVYNRHGERARELVRRFGAVAEVAADLESALQGATLVVNATPVGQHSDDHPVPLALLPPDAAVFDLVVRADETHWVRAARAAGHRAADGEGMLLEQGAESFERWFGIRPDRGAMWRALH